MAFKILSKNLLMYIDKANRAGRITFRNAKNAAYTATNPFHWPGANGDKPVYDRTSKIREGAS